MVYSSWLAISVENLVTIVVRLYVNIHTYPVQINVADFSIVRVGLKDVR